MEELLFSDGISHVIQLAVAPVFLLASISGALNVLSIRMGRIIDRGRSLNELVEAGKPHDEADIDREQKQLAIRARLTHRAIGLCTLSALFVSLVIVFLFVDALFTAGLQWFIAGLFVVALLFLITGLVTFLREIELSANAFRFGRYHMKEKMKGKKEKS